LLRGTEQGIDLLRAACGCFARLIHANNSWAACLRLQVVAGFLVEHLNLHWIDGEKWFHETLVDADVAINAYMWQNGGHSGVDQV